MALIKIKNSNGAIITIDESKYNNIYKPAGWQKVDNNQTVNSSSNNENLTLSKLLNNPKVKNDKGINGTTMAKWIRRNATLIPRLAALGYTVNDIINEAYSQTRYNKSAFSGDMTTMPAQENRDLNKKTNYSPREPSSSSETGAPESSQSENGLTAEQKAAIDQLNEDINRMDLSYEQKAILKEIAKGDYTSGQKIPNTQELNQIIQDAAINAEKDLAPYYEKITARDLEDLRNNMADIRNQAARYQQQEALSYKDTLAKIKQNLRARGLTFSGISRAELGNESALTTDKNNRRYSPAQEGRLATARRYNWKDQLATWQEQGRNFGTEAERKLGSATLEDYGKLINPYAEGTTYNPEGRISLFDPHKQGSAGYIKSYSEVNNKNKDAYTSDLALERLKETEKNKWDRISKYRPYI